MKKQNSIWREFNMLSKSMYTSEYIQQLRDRTGADPTLLERMIYAFGLLEAVLFMPRGLYLEDFL